MENKGADSTDGGVYDSSENLSIRPRETITSRPTKEDEYDVSHTNIGYALILNQINFDKKTKREGSKKDGSDLEKVLTDIGFTVRHFTDLTRYKIREQLKMLSETDHSNNDCLLIVMMTHGDDNGIIYSRDYEFNVTELWENFIGDNCPSLIGKPKLFFIQACRGKMADPGVYYKPKSSIKKVPADFVDSEVYVIPSLSDILIHYSTSGGFYSIRNNVHGSWFIQAICKELRDISNREICEILTCVNRNVAFEKEACPKDVGFCKQSPIFQSSLMKKFYLAKKNDSLSYDTEFRKSLLAFYEIYQEYSENT